MALLIASYDSLFRKYYGSGEAIGVKCIILIIPIVKFNKKSTFQMEFGKFALYHLS